VPERFVLQPRSTHRAALGATEADIEFDLDDHRLVLRVRDNGRGFHADLCRQGNGLANMRRRAAALGGSVDVRASEGEGVAITVTAPL
jgi:signal transduction histidine kinase